jgi:hypothetical protein
MEKLNTAINKTYAVKTYEGMEVRVHHSYSQHWVEVSGKLHAPAVLCLRKEPQVPTEEEAGRASEHSGHHRVEKKLLLLPGIKSKLLDHQACSLCVYTCIHACIRLPVQFLHADEQVDMLNTQSHILKHYYHWLFI